MNLLEAVVEEMCFLERPYVRPQAVLDRCEPQEPRERRRRREMLNKVLVVGQRRRIKKKGFYDFMVLPVDVPKLVLAMSLAGLDIRNAEAFLAWKPAGRGPGRWEKQRSMRYWTCNALVKMTGNGQEWVTVAQVHEECVSDWKNLVWVGKIVKEFSVERKMLRKGGKRAFWYRIDLEKLEKWYKNEYGM